MFVTFFKRLTCIVVFCSLVTVFIQPAFAIGADFNVVSGTFGAGELAANTTGTNNTAIGYQSLYNNTTGVSNTALGSGAGNAGTANTVGTLNTGAVTLGAGAKFFATLTSTGNDLLNATGNVNLNRATLDGFVGAGVTTGASFTIIQTIA